MTTLARCGSRTIEQNGRFLLIVDHGTGWTYTTRFVLRKKKGARLDVTWQQSAFLTLRRQRCRRFSAKRASGPVNSDRGPMGQSALPPHERKGNVPPAHPPVRPIRIATRRSRRKNGIDSDRLT